MTATHGFRRLAAVASSLALVACGTDTTAAAPVPAALRLERLGRDSILASLGDTAAFRAVVVDAAGQPVEGAAITWRVTRDSVLAQDAAGTFRALDNGRTTVVAEVQRAGQGVRPGAYFVGRVADSVVVEVRQQAASLRVVADTQFTALGAARTVRAALADARGNPLRASAPAPALAWRSGDPRIVSVDSTGTVRAIADGSAPVTVQAGTLAGQATFTVNARLPHTSCMVFTRRREQRQRCVTLAVTRRAAGTTP